MYIKIGNRKERNMEILFLNPVFKEAIWGGKLLKEFGLDGDGVYKSIKEIM